jgi:ubiquinone/menaquinone biosynthesis C-methylase UbiE
MPLCSGGHRRRRKLAITPSLAVATDATWELTCVRCHCKLRPEADPSKLSCGKCGTVYFCVDGIWRLLTPKQQEVFGRFLRDYTHIRLAEGRGSEDPEFYRRLPECDPNHPLAWQWRFHKQTLRCFADRILPRLGLKLKILDLGAGVGWLSNQFAKRGHYPCAIDVTVDEQDGLAAARHYAPDWPRIQADFDHLPLADNSVDCVVYNASLHYSVDYATTLAEARRVLRPKGCIVVLESPIYKRDESGRKMVAERHAQFERRFGTRSDAIRSIEYLTWDMLAHLGRELNLTWDVSHPWYGLPWAMRPWIARLKRKREPSQFAILVGHNSGAN